MKTFRKSSLISSVALLLVAIVALSGATFAWFSTKADASATGINATTSKGSQLVIANTAEGVWSQKMELNVDADLEPVTPVDTTFATWKKATAAAYDTQVADGEYKATEAGDFYTKRIFVKYSAAEGTHALKADITLANAEYSENADFYRVAFVPVAGTDENKVNTVADATYKVYSIAAYNRADDATYGEYDVTTVATDIELGTLDADKVVAYDVYVWFEGEDADCKDSNSVNSIGIDIAFK